MKTIVKNKELFKITDSLYEALMKDEELLKETPLREANEGDYARKATDDMVKVESEFNTSTDLKYRMSKVYEACGILVNYISKLNNPNLDELQDIIENLKETIFTNFEYYNVESFYEILREYKEDYIQELAIKNNEEKFSETDLTDMFKISARRIYNNYCDGIPSNVLLAFMKTQVYEILNAIGGSVEFKYSELNGIMDLSDIRNSYIFNKVANNILDEWFAKVVEDKENEEKDKENEKIDKEALNKFKKGEDRKKVINKIEKKTKERKNKLNNQNTIDDRLNFINFFDILFNRLKSVGVYYGIHYIFLMPKGMSLENILPSSEDVEIKYEKTKKELESRKNVMKQERYEEELNNLEQYRKDILEKINNNPLNDIIGQKQLSKISTYFGELLNRKYLEIMSNELNAGNSGSVGMYSNAYKLYILAFNRETFSSINDLLSTDITLRKEYFLKMRSVPFIFKIPYIQYDVLPNDPTGFNAIPDDKNLVCFVGVTLYSELFNKVFTKKAFNNLKEIISMMSKRNKGVDW